MKYFKIEYINRANSSLVYESKTIHAKNLFHAIDIFLGWLDDNNIVILAMRYETLEYKKNKF